MAIDSASKRRSALNYMVPVYRHGPIPDGDLDTVEDRRTMLHHYFGVGAGATAYIFDLRVMNQAVTESGGQAANTNNLGTISYVFDDMKNIDGKVLLPFG